MEMVSKLHVREEVMDRKIEEEARKVFENMRSVNGEKKIG